MDSLLSHYRHLTCKSTFIFLETHFSLGRLAFNVLLLIKSGRQYSIDDPIYKWLRNHVWHLLSNVFFFLPITSTYQSIIDLSTKTISSSCTSVSVQFFRCFLTDSSLLFLPLLGSVMKKCLYIHICREKKIWIHSHWLWYISFSFYIHKNLTW